MVGHISMNLYNAELRIIEPSQENREGVPIPGFRIQMFTSSLEFFQTLRAVRFSYGNSQTLRIVTVFLVVE